MKQINAKSILDLLFDPCTLHDGLGHIICCADGKTAAEQRFDHAHMPSRPLTEHKQCCQTNYNDRRMLEILHHGVILHVKTVSEVEKYQIKCTAAQREEIWRSAGFMGNDKQQRNGEDAQSDAAKSFRRYANHAASCFPPQL